MADYFTSQRFVRTLREVSSETETQVEEQLTLSSTTPVGTPSAGAPYSNESTILVSNTFYFTASLDPLAPEVVISSIDGLFFAVHWHRLMAASINGFGGLLAPEAHALTHDSLVTIVVPERSEVLNVALHGVYNLSCDTYGPGFECMEASLECMKKYGLVPLARYLSNDRPLFNTILNLAPRRPIEVYALAAANDLEDAAVAASAYTLHLKLHQSISLALAEKIGPVYLDRLYALHGMRLDTLKQLLDENIYPHVAKAYCSVEQRQVVSRAYRLACAQVFYDATAGLPRTTIERVMNDLADAISCPDCQDGIKAHVRELVTKWMLLDRTIARSSSNDSPNVIRL